MKANRRIVIIGATSAMAEHCARLWVGAHPVDVTLVGRDASRIERVAEDLRVRSPSSTVTVMLSDFVEPEGIRNTVNRIVECGVPDIVLIAQGSLPDQAACQQDLVMVRDALDINGMSPVLFAEAFARHFANAGKGTLAVIGSVAGDRGRKSNYVYGAAKGMLARYAEGLQHRFAGTKVKVVVIKPGPTDTPMTAHLKSAGAKLASVEQVAKAIVDAIERGQASVYVPGKWRLIMWVIRHMPRQIFNRLNI